MEFLYETYSKTLLRHALMAAVLGVTCVKEHLGPQPGNRVHLNPPPLVVHQAAIKTTLNKDPEWELEVYHSLAAGFYVLNRERGVARWFREERS